MEGPQQASRDLCPRPLPSPPHLAPDLCACLDQRPCPAASRGCCRLCMALLCWRLPCTHPRPLTAPTTQPSRDRTLLSSWCFSTQPRPSLHSPHITKVQALSFEESAPTNQRYWTSRTIQRPASNKCQESDLPPGSLRSSPSQCPFHPLPLSAQSAAAVARKCSRPPRSPGTQSFLLFHL